MTTTLSLKPKAEAVQDAPVEAVTLQERIDAMVAEAVKNAPPALSAEEQRKKNQGAIDLLNQWRLEDATDDPEQIAKSLAEWEEFKKNMNENHSSNRLLFP